MNVEALVDRYCAGWSARDPGERAAILASVLTPDASYCDPGTEGDLELEALLRYIEGVHARWPGAVIVRTSRVDLHHRYARFCWCLQLAGGEPLPEGIDFVRLSPARDRLSRITGFFGPVDSPCGGNRRT